MPVANAFSLRRAALCLLHGILSLTLAAGSLAMFSPADAFAAPASDGKIEAAFTKAKADYMALREDRKRRKYRDNWIQVAEKLEAVAKKYPKSSRAPDALYNAAKLYSDLYRVSLAERDRQASLDAWERLYAGWPKSSLADDAHFERGNLCLRGRTPDFETARDEYKKAIALKGDMSGEAKKALAQLPPPPPAKKGKDGGKDKPSAANGADKAGKSGAASTDANRRADLAAGFAKASAGAGQPAGQSAAAKDPKDAPKGPEKASAVASNQSEGDRKTASPSTADEGENLFDAGQMAAFGKASSEGGIPLAVQMGLKIKRVIVDAGHGGHDTGAIGKEGTREKDVVLPVALKLKKALTDMGYDVMLTRETDKFIALEERARFANRNKGDLFISLHCNAAENRKLSGVETYTLNVASDRYSMRLAAMENQSSERSVSDLQLVLADLSRKANTSESLQLARAIHPTIVSAMKDGKNKVHDHGLKQALFYVLLGVRMPSVLVEMGFISNPREEKLLKEEATQQKLADSMAKGIARFIKDRNALAEGKTVERPAVKSATKSPAKPAAKTKTTAAGTAKPAAKAPAKPAAKGKKK